MSNLHKYLPHANFFINIFPHLIPLSIWLFLIYKYYFPFLMSKSSFFPSDLLRHPGKITYILVILFPFIITFQSLIKYKKELQSNKYFISDLWPICTTTTHKHTKEYSSGILGYFNTNCANSQTDFNKNYSYNLEKRSYYLNYILFLLILVYGKIILSPSYSYSKTNIVFISISLILAIIGELSPLFTNDFLMSYITLNMFSTFLNINVGAFLFAVLSLYDK